MTINKTLTSVQTLDDGSVMCSFDDFSIYYASLEQLNNAVVSASSSADNQLQLLLLMLWMQDGVIGRTAILDTDNPASVVTTHV